MTTQQLVLSLVLATMVFSVALELKVADFTRVAQTPRAVICGLIPQFLLFFNIGWYGTYLPLIVPAFTGNAFFVFLLRQYMRTIPRELDEAARIDGAGYFTVYRRIILPLTTPALTVVAVFTFLGTWNDFFGPLIYLQDPEMFTVAVALATQVSRVGVEWNFLMASNLLAIIPPLVIYFFAQNKLIGGIASVGIRG